MILIREKENKEDLDWSNNKELTKLVNTLSEGKTIIVPDNIRMDKSYIKKGYTFETKFTLVTNFGKTFLTFPNALLLILYCKKEIKKIEYKEPIETNIIIPIVDIHKSNYKGKDMKWTEPLTDKYISKNIKYGWHYSDKPISSFANILTCFFTSPKRNYIKNGYKIYIPKDTEIFEHGNGEEIRVELNEKFKIVKLKNGWCDYKIIK